FCEKSEGAVSCSLAFCDVGFLSPVCRDDEREISAACVTAVVAGCWQRDPDKNRRLGRSINGSVVAGLGCGGSPLRECLSGLVARNSCSAAAKRISFLECGGVGASILFRRNRCPHFGEFRS